MSPQGTVITSTKRRGRACAKHNSFEAKSRQPVVRFWAIINRKTASQRSGPSEPGASVTIDTREAGTGTEIEIITVIELWALGGAAEALSDHKTKDNKHES